MSDPDVANVLQHYATSKRAMGTVHEQASTSSYALDNSVVEISTPAVQKAKHFPV